MRVLHLLSSTGIYGVENMVIELLQSLSRENVESFLGLLENSSNAHLEIAKKAKKCINNIEIFSCNGKFDINSILQLRKVIERYNIDIIHSHKYKSNFYCLLASISKEVPLISTCHNWLSNNFKMKIYEWLDKKVLNHFDKIVAVSDEVKEKILQSGINQSKVLKIKNGISIEKYQEQNGRKNIRNEFGIDDETIVIGSLGRLDRNKGITYLLEAAKILLNERDNVLFLIVGDGPSKQELYHKAVELGIREKVILTGFRDDVPSVFSSIDIFVLPSLIEGLPMVLLEAMASKKPIIATKVGDIPNVITHNETGFLIDPGSVEQLKHALLYILKNRNHSDLIVEKGFETVKNEYSSKSTARHYIEVYNEIHHDRAENKRYLKTL